MARLPVQVSKLLESISTNFPGLLGGDLVGIYIYGSLTQRAFDAKRSDIDLVVATRRDLTERQFARMAEWLKKSEPENNWTARLQMMIIAKDDIFKMNARACHYQFGKFRRDGSDGNPIPWINILESGITLYGPPPETWVPEITSEMFFETLVREALYLRDELAKKESEWRDVPKYSAYAVLTVCRILYSLKKGKIVSKPRAAKWALVDLPVEWHSLINSAIGHDAGRPAKLPLREVKKFVQFALNQLKGPPGAFRSDALPDGKEFAGLMVDRRI
jgi:Domain of unknown function (DUF4111)